MSSRAQTVAEVIGAALITAGVALVYIPAALIVAGGALVLVGNLPGKGKR